MTSLDDINEYICRVFMLCEGIQTSNERVECGDFQDVLCGLHLFSKIESLPSHTNYSNSI